MNKYNVWPTGITKVTWDAFVDWFLGLPDVDESLLLPRNGLWNEGMLTFLMGFDAGYNQQ